MAAWPGVVSAGVGVPGLYDPEAGTTRFLVNVPGAWAGRPVAGPVAARLGVPVFLINDARAFGLAELRLGAGRGAGSMVGPHAGDRRGRRDRGRRPGPPGPRRHGRRAGPPDDRPGRAAVRLRQPRLPRGVRARRPDRGGVRHGDRRGGGGPRPGRRSAGARGAGPDRPLPGHRDREHDRRAVARIGSSSAAASPRRATCCSRRSATSWRRGCGRRRSTPSSWCRRSSGSGPARSGRRSTARSGRPAGRRGQCRRECGPRRPPMAPDRAHAARADPRAGAGRPAAVGHGAVRGVRRQPDDRAQRDAAPGRRGPDRPRSRDAAASSPSCRPTVAPTG